MFERLGHAIYRHRRLVLIASLVAAILWRPQPAAPRVGLNTLVTLEILLPSAFFFSVLAAIGRLYRDSEMSALYAAGVSRARPAMRSSFVAVAGSIISKPPSRYAL